MKDLLLKNKFQLLAIGLILALFIFTLFLRKDRLESDLIPGSEWISAHTLITNEIWDENGGPSNYHFSPVYTYNWGSRLNRSLGGVTDGNGNLYYVSYPPFAFIFSYYGMKILGGHSVHNLRALNLIVHFFCALFIYLIIYKLSERKADHFSISAVFSAFLYLFSTGTLRIHSVMYFCDTLVQLFIIYGIYLAIKLLKNDYSSELKILLALGFTFFLASYTEWLGIFLAFYLGIGLLLMFFFTKKRIYLKAFLTLGVSSFLALSLTFYQYSLISGMDNLIEVSAQKYEIRSGHNGPEISNSEANYKNPESYQMLLKHFEKHFLMLIHLIAIFSILIIPFIAYRKARLKMTGIKLKIGLIAILFISILSHLFVFFNFNSLHDFANLKAGLLIILIIGAILLLIEQSLNLSLKLLLAGLLIYLGFSQANREYNRYLNIIPKKQNEQRLISSAAKKKHTSAHQMAYSNMKHLNPEYIYLAHHMPFYVPDTNNIAFLMNGFEMDTSQYYHHSGDTLKYINEYTWDGKNLVRINQISFETNK